MDTTNEILQSRWPQLKVNIRRHWSKITEDDLKQLNGNSDNLIHVLRKRYGYGKVQAEIEINNWLAESDEIIGKPK